MANNEAELIRRHRQGQMAKRLQDELGDALDQQEEQIINEALRATFAGRVLDPQFAVQQWLALAAVRRFRRSLQQKEKEAASAATKIAGNLT